LKRAFHIRLPATSANLGPAFDTAAVALNMHLDVTAEAAEEFSIAAEGRDAAQCGRLEENLIVQTYRQILKRQRRIEVPLRLRVENAIPLGMGCGSSAAARLAGIALALQFGEIEWRGDEIVAVATALEGHPDNVSACWFGGMTVSAVSSGFCAQKCANNLPRERDFPKVSVARFDVPPHWRPVLVLPRESVRTEESRKILPEHYSRADTVANLQHAALLVGAFASGDSGLLRAAMHDRVHQPYRSSICPILGQMQDISQEEGVLGVALSGAGPGVLMIVERSLNENSLQCLLHRKLGGLENVEVLRCGFENKGKTSMFDCF